jgi:type IV secretory pathway VirB2 component (pilin)
MITLAEVQAFCTAANAASTPQTLMHAVHEITARMGFRYFALVHHIDLLAPDGSGIYTNIDGKLDLFLNERLNNVIDVVRGPLALGLVIYIALFGYMVMRGIVSEPWGELFYRMVKLCLLYIAATTVAYSDWICRDH